MPVQRASESTEPVSLFSTPWFKTGLSEAGGATEKASRAASQGKVDGKKFGGDGMQPGFRAYRPPMSSTGDPTVSSGGLRIWAYSASASGFRTAAILARLDLVIVEPHEAMEVGAGSRADGLRRERGGS